MVHSLRKYLSNRGSALFMVISTMTALMVTCMAMYFAVVSSRTAQYAVFNQEQSYQAARSTSELLLGGLQSGSLAAGSNNLMDKMIHMTPGQVITTDGNGFASLNPEATGMDDDILGAYDVTIKRLKDEDVDNVNHYTYDVAVTTSINGMRETVHSIIHIKPGTPEPIDMDPQIFAATGYTDQDTYLDAGLFLTDMFIDNENTITGAYTGALGGGNMKFTRNLTVGGSLTSLGYMQPSETEPVVWSIRDSFINNGTSYNFKSTESKRSVLLIGGDLVADGNAWPGITNVDIYINGDFYYARANYTGSRIFVHGDIHVQKAHRDLSAIPIYCDGSIIEEEGGIAQNSVKGTWENNPNFTKDNFSKGAMTRTKAMTQLDKATTSSLYYKWEITDNYPVVDLKYNKHRNASSGEYGTYTQTLTYSEKNTGCTIGDITVAEGNNSVHDQTLIIDTGANKDNVYTIKLKANSDYDGDGRKESFSWSPSNSFGAGSFNVLIKGNGSVVVQIPEGVIYQETTRLKTMHYNWFMLAGGTVEKGPAADGSQDHYYCGDINYTSLINFVHTDCGGEHDNCTYETEEEYTDKECTICKRRNCDDCKHLKKKATCKLHEYTFYYCPCKNCEKDLEDANFAGKCVNRVGRQEIDEYLASHSDVKDKMEKINGKVVYPTTNFFLISSEESADIRMSSTIGGDAVSHNQFFGYIYAPYMTFKGYGEGSGGGVIRYFGGATISDMILQANNAYITCWPEKLPEELMSDKNKENVLYGSSKDWRISLGSY